MSYIRRNRKRERYLKYKNRQEKKAANFHGYFYHDEIYENGEAIKIHKPYYVRFYHREAAGYLKRSSNRKIRHCKSYLPDGNYCHKLFDFWRKYD